MRVDFYVTTNNEPDAIWLLACRLVEKAYQRGHRVFIHCQNQQDAEHIDELLWTYKDDSFIPHNLQGEGPEPPPPVQIGFVNEPRGFNDILINLCVDIPSFYSRFNRIIELVAASEEAKVKGRQRYKDYRQKGCELHMHTID
jgi:DNA polymerase-3 subunit chi